MTQTEVTTKTTVRDAVFDELRQEGGGPLAASVLVRRVLARVNVILIGQTPVATVTSVISTATRRGELVRVERGVYALPDTS